LAEVRPELLHAWQAPRYLLPYLDSEDPVVRALASRALGRLRVVAAAARIKQYAAETTEFSLYAEQRLTTVTTGQLARAALAALAPVVE
jgi:transglutaminase-like putative cysteine protease